MKSITGLKNLKNKKVLLRVDFNVPLSGKRVADSARVQASLPTIKFLLKKKAKVIIVSHLGRPEGKIARALKLDPVVRELGVMLGKPVKKLETGNWRWSEKKRAYFKKQIDQMRPGQVIMLDNIRFSPDEEKNSVVLARELAGLADIFVLDGFAVAHRAAASVSGVAQLIPSFAGLLLTAEIKGLEKVLKRPEKPFVAVLGGIKTASKTPLLKNLLPKVNHILLGGGLLNSYLLGKKYRIGASVAERESAPVLKRVLAGKKLVRPVDLVVGDKNGKNFRLVALGRQPHKICAKEEAIFDIGPETICLYAGYIKSAKTLLWNGAVGYFEQKPYNIGTFAIARLVAARSRGKAFGVIGGGETVQAMAATGMEEFVDLVSTGGGAMLEFLSGKVLPGIKALGSKK